MRRIRLWSLAGAVVVLSGWLGATGGRCAEKVPAEKIPAGAEKIPAEKIPYVDAETVLGWVEKGEDVVYVDARDPDEYAAGHIPGSFNVPVEKGAAGAAGLPKKGHVVIYCIHSAHRAPALGQVLFDHGVKDISVVEGGLTALREAGATLESSDRPTPEILQATDRCKAPADH